MGDLFVHHALGSRRSFPTPASTVSASTPISPTRARRRPRRCPDARGGELGRGFGVGVPERRGSNRRRHRLAARSSVVRRTAAGRPAASRRRDQCRTVRPRRQRPSWRRPSCRRRWPAVVLFARWSCAGRRGDAVVAGRPSRSSSRKVQPHATAVSISSSAAWNLHVVAVGRNLGGLDQVHEDQALVQSASGPWWRDALAVAAVVLLVDPHPANRSRPCLRRARCRRPGPLMERPVRRRVCAVPAQAKVAPLALEWRAITRPTDWSTIRARAGG